MKLRKENGKVIVEPWQCDEENYLKELAAKGGHVKISQDVPQANGSHRSSPNSAKDA